MVLDLLVDFDTGTVVVGTLLMAGAFVVVGTLLVAWVAETFVVGPRLETCYRLHLIMYMIGKSAYFHFHSLFLLPARL